MAMNLKKMRSHGHVEAENHERWLVSYADYVTLLFAFFVVLYASSQVNHQRAKSVSDSVRRAYREDHIISLLQSVMGKPKSAKVIESPAAEVSAKAGTQDAVKAMSVNDAVVAELVPSLESLQAALQEEIRHGKIQMKMEARGLVVTLQEAAFFPAGEAALLPDTIPTIGKVAEAISKLSLPVRLEGHTDSSPIQTSRYSSNWDLSTARAISMLNLMTQRFGIPSQRFAVAGYADTLPVESNDTAVGRARNRRVEVVILNRSAIPYQPTAVQEAAKKR